MGKPSRLKAKQDEIDRTGTRWEAPDGTRKLYDRDKPPEGCDPDVWSLALLFEQEAEIDHLRPEPRPVLYTELKHRVSDEFKKTDDWYGVAENMIALFWKERESDRNLINSLCSSSTWNYYKMRVLEARKRNDLLSRGRRVPNEVTSRQAISPDPVAVVMTASYTEDQIQFILGKYLGEWD